MGMSAPLVRAEIPVDLLVVVAERAGMNLHHHAVLHAHPSHLHQHVCLEEPLIRRRGSAGQGFLKQRFGLLLREGMGVRLQHGMVRRDGSHRAEEGAASFQRRDERVKGADGMSADPTEGVQLLLPVGAGDAEQRVGPEAGDDAAVPVRVPDGPVFLERSRGGVRRSEHLDVEAVEQRARQELRGGQALGDLIVDVHGRVAVQPVPNAEDVVELVVEPGARGGAGKKVEVIREALPDGTRVGFHRAAVEPRDAQVFQPHAPRVEHAEDVMVRDDDERGGFRERRVGSQQTGVHVAVRPDDGQISDLLVERAGDAAARGIRVEEAVGMQFQGFHGMGGGFGAMEIRKALPCSRTSCHIRCAKEAWDGA